MFLTFPLTKNWYNKIGTKIGIFFVKPRFTHLKFFSERGYSICHRAFLLKGVMRFVKNRRDPKIGTIGEVIGVYQPRFTHLKFFSERSY